MENYKLVTSLGTNDHEDRGTMSSTLVGGPQGNHVSTDTNHHNASAMEGDGFHQQQQHPPTSMKAIYDAASEEERQMALQYAEDLLKAFNAEHNSTTEHNKSRTAASIAAPHHESNVSISSIGSRVSSSSRHHNPFSISAARVERMQRQQQLPPSTTTDEADTTTCRRTATLSSSGEDHEVSITHQHETVRGFDTPPRSSRAMYNYRGHTATSQSSSNAPSAVPTPTKEAVGLSGINTSVLAPPAQYHTADAAAPHRDLTTLSTLSVGNMVLSGIHSTLSGAFYSSPQLVQLRQLYTDTLISSADTIFHSLMHEVPHDHILRALMLQGGTSSATNQSQHHRYGDSVAITAASVHDETSWSRVGECVREHLYSLQTQQFHAVAADLAQAQTTIQSLQYQLVDTKRRETDRTKNVDKDISSLRKKIALVNKQIVDDEMKFAAKLEDLKQMTQIQIAQSDTHRQISLEEQTSFTNILLEFSHASTRLSRLEYIRELEVLQRAQATTAAAAQDLKDLAMRSSTANTSAADVDLYLFPPSHDDTLPNVQLDVLGGGFDGAEDGEDTLEHSSNSGGHFVPRPPSTPSPVRRRREQEDFEHKQRLDLNIQEQICRSEVERGYLESVLASCSEWMSHFTEMSAADRHYLFSQLEDIHQINHANEEAFTKYTNEMQSRCELLVEKSDALEEALRVSQNMLDHNLQAHASQSIAAYLHNVSTLEEEEGRYRTMLKSMAMTYLTTLALLMGDTLLLNYSIEGSVHEDLWRVRREAETTLESAEIRHKMQLESVQREVFKHQEMNNVLQSSAQNKIMEIEFNSREVVEEMALSVLEASHISWTKFYKQHLLQDQSRNHLLEGQASTFKEIRAFQNDEFHCRLECVFSQEVDRAELFAVLTKRIDSLHMTEAMEIHLASLTHEQSILLKEQRIELEEERLQALKGQKEDMMQQLETTIENRCRQATSVVNEVSAMELLEQRWRYNTLQEASHATQGLIVQMMQDRASIDRASLISNHHLEIEKAIEHTTSHITETLQETAREHLQAQLGEQLAAYETKLKEAHRSFGDTLRSQSDIHQMEVESLRNNNILTETKPMTLDTPITTNPVSSRHQADEGMLLELVVASYFRQMQEHHFKASETVLLSWKASLDAMEVRRERALRDEFANELSEALRVSEGECVDAVERADQLAKELSVVELHLSNQDQDNLELLEAIQTKHASQITAIRSELESIIAQRNELNAQTILRSHQLESAMGLLNGLLGNIRTPFIENVSSSDLLCSDAILTVALEEPQSRLLLEHEEAVVFNMLDIQSFHDRAAIYNHAHHCRLEAIETVRTDKVVRAVEDRIVPLILQQYSQSNTISSLTQTDIEGAFVNILEQLLVGEGSSCLSEHLEVTTTPSEEVVVSEVTTAMTTTAVLSSGGRTSLQELLARSLTTPLLRHITSLIESVSSTTSLSTKAADPILLSQIASDISSLKNILQDTPAQHQQLYRLEGGESSTTNESILNRLQSELNESRHMLELHAVDRESSRAILRSLLAWVDSGASAAATTEDAASCGYCGVFELCETLSRALHQCRVEKRSSSSHSLSEVDKVSFLQGQLSVLHQDVRKYKASLSALRTTSLQQIQKAEIMMRSTVVERLSEFESSWRQGTMKELEEFARDLSQGVHALIKDVLEGNHHHAENGIATSPSHLLTNNNNNDIAAPRALVRPFLSMVARDLKHSIATTLDQGVQELLSGRDGLEEDLISMRDELRDATILLDFEKKRLEGQVHERASALEETKDELSEVRAVLLTTSSELSEIRIRYSLDFDNWKKASSDKEIRQTTEVSDLQTKINLLTSECDSLTAQLRRSVTECDVLSSNINTHWAPSQDALSKRIEEMAQERGQLQRNAVDEATMRGLLEQRIIDLEERITKAHQEHELELVKLAAAHKAHIDNIRTQASNELEANIQRLTDRIAALDEKYNNLMEEKRAAENALRAQIVDLRTRVSEDAVIAEKCMQDLREEHDLKDGGALLLLQRERDEYVAEMKDSHKKELGQLSDRLKESLHKCDTVEQAHNELKIVYEDLEHEMGNMKNGTLFRYEQESGRLKEKISELQEVLAVEQASVRSLKSSVAHLQEQLNDAEKASESHRRSADQSSKSLEELRIRENEARVALIESDELVTSLQSDIDLQKRRLHDAEMDSLENVGEIQALQSKLQIVGAERDRHQETAYDLHRELLEVRREKQSLIENLQARVTFLSRSLVDEERRNGDLHRRFVDDHERNLQRSQSVSTTSEAVSSSFRIRTASSSHASPPLISTAAPFNQRAESTYLVSSRKFTATMRPSDDNNIGGRYAELASSIRTERELSANNARQSSVILRPHPSTSPHNNASPTSNYGLHLSSLRSQPSSIKRPHVGEDEDGASPIPNVPSPSLQRLSKNGVMLEYSPNSQDRVDGGLSPSSPGPSSTRVVARDMKMEGTTTVALKQKGLLIGRRDEDEGSSRSPTGASSSCGPSFSPAREIA